MLGEMTQMNYMMTPIHSECLLYTAIYQNGLDEFIELMLNIRH